MHRPSDTDDGRAPGPADPGRPRSRAWLLAVPLVLLAWPPLYNREEPVVVGIPFFYAYQLIMIPTAAVCTWLVYCGDARRQQSGTPEGGRFRGVLRGGRFRGGRFRGGRFRGVLRSGRFRGGGQAWWASSRRSASAATRSTRATAVSSPRLHSRRQATTE
jgi:hypothetical protein